MAMIKNSKQKGLGVFELLVTIGIISILITLAVPGFDSHFKRLEITNTLRTITGVLNTARFEAISTNKRVQFCISNQEGGTLILLKEKIGSRWHEFKRFYLEKSVSVSSNASPVFFPVGSVSPLCSISVANDRRHFRVTISMAGRIQVTEVSG